MAGQRPPIFNGALELQTRAKCLVRIVPPLVTAAEVMNTCFGMSWSMSPPSMRYFRHTSASAAEPLFGSC